MRKFILFLIAVAICTGLPICLSIKLAKANIDINNLRGQLQTIKDENHDLWDVVFKDSKNAQEILDSGTLGPRENGKLHEIVGDN